MVGARHLLIAASFLLVALSGCTAGGSQFSEPAPTWQPGYSWAYDVDIQGEWTETSDGETDNGTWDEAYSEVYEVLNTKQVVEGEPVYLVANQFGDWGSQLMGFRKADLAQFYLDYDECDDADCASPLELEMYRSHDEIPSAYRFPLTGDQKWSDRIVEDEGSFEIQIVFSSRVTGYETVDTPVGPVDAIAIQRTMRVQNLQEVLDGLRDEIEEEGVRVIELSGDLVVRGTEYYAPSYQNMVSSRMEEHSVFNLVVEADGERFEERENSRVTYTSQLTGARLQPGPEKELDQILAVLAGDEDLIDPAGETVADVGYTLGISVANDEVNVADGEAFSFTAIIDGEMPAQHSLQWSAFDAIGTTVASGDGSSFSEVPALPGVYTVLVQSLDGAKVIQSAYTTATGHYRTTLTSTCGLVEVNGIGVPSDCSSNSIPVRPGIASLDIQATTGSPVEVVNSGAIRLTDSLGSAIDSRNHGGSHDMYMDDMLYAYAVSGVDWDLDWFQEAGALESEVTFTVDLTYGLEGGVPMRMEVEMGEHPVALPVVGGLPAWLQGRANYL